MLTPAFKVVIPARYASTRLPAKPLLDLGGKPMVVRVAERLHLEEMILHGEHRGAGVLGGDGRRSQCRAELRGVAGQKIDEMYA